ncbi:clostripain-related cysteine peptidase [Parabacteroides sp. OttesenSCG-928-G07]|nr:clostripain-related cysteine peptidase [Parabacteroides sp. OttesenSCG-928-G07]
MKLKFILYSVLLSVLFVSCEKDDPVIINPYKRTVLVYLIAENNLSSYSNQNIRDMLNGVTKETLNNGNLLVYWDPSDKPPRLLKIDLDKHGKADTTTVKVYEEQNSASPEVVRNVINETLNNFKADSYGLVLWSHGSSWLPANYASMLRWFGQDGNNKMDIKELSSAIPDNVFDFILFDACYMASIEVIYELRNKASYIIGSPVEILGNGFPYQLIIKPLFSTTLDLTGICDNFYNFYDQQTGLHRSAAVSITATEYLEELTQVTREILNGKETEVHGLSVTNIQKLDYLASSRILYDFDDFIKNFASEEQYINFQTALSNAIIYKEHTPKSTFVAGGSAFAIDINYFSGLSTYIPRSSYSLLNEWYRENTDWYKAVYE